MTIRRAVPGDLHIVLSILHSVAHWLHRQGYEQWPDGSPSLGPIRIGAQIERGEFWLVNSGRDPVAVIALSTTGDSDFWSPTELDETSVYLSKAAVVRRMAGHGVGALVLRWAQDRAASEGARWVRLDVWKTNTGLQEYYAREGWQYVRTVECARRNSGALFQRPSEPDPEARAAFSLRTSREDVDVIKPGMPVIVPADGGPVSATVTEVTVDGSYGISETGWEHTGGLPRIYLVERDGKTWVARDAWPDLGELSGRPAHRRRRSFGAVSRGPGAVSGRTSRYQSPDLTLREVRPADRYLLCSDGLSGVIPSNVIRQVLSADSAADETVHERRPGWQGRRHGQHNRDCHRRRRQDRVTEDPVLRETHRGVETC